MNKYTKKGIIENKDGEQMKTINYRQKQRTIITTTALIAMVLIITLTIVYAALSTTLNISGSSTINASNWDIKINNSTTTANTTTGTATYTTPTISGSTINYGVGLTKPSDSVTLYFDMVNNGDALGEITSIMNSTPVCTSPTGNSEDEELVCNNLEIIMIYTDNIPIQTGDLLMEDGKICRNDVISQWSSQMKIVIKLKDSMNELPTAAVNVTNLKLTIIFSQTDKTCSTSSCFVAGTKVAVENGYKNIEDVKSGDYVYSYNLETNKKELKKVLETFIHQKDEIYTLKVNNQLIYTTEEHPFYVINKGWINAEKLKFNDKLLSIKTGPTNIQNISKRNNKTYVYNFEVEDNHNYLITKEDLLVHNKTHSGSGGN